MTRKDNERKINRALGSSTSASVGAKAGTANYAIKIGGNTTTAVNIIDKTAGRIGKNGKAVGQWIARVDNPHSRTNFPHININRKVSGIRDPHINIGSSSSVAVAEGMARVLKGANKVLLPLSIATDTARIAFAIAQDVEKGKGPKRTVRTTASVAGGWGGGYGGATAGAAIGTATFPGLGTILGGIIGGIAGGVGGSLGAEAIANAIYEEATSDCSDDEDEE